MKKAALTDVCFPKLHLQTKEKKKKFSLISNFWALPEWSSKGMTPKLKQKTHRKTTTSVIPVVTNKPLKQFPSPTDGSQMRIKHERCCSWPLQVFPLLFTLPSPFVPPHLKGS